MGSKDYREQFSSAISALGSFELAYVHVMDGLGFGFHKLGARRRLPPPQAQITTRSLGSCRLDPLHPFYVDFTSGSESEASSACFEEQRARESKRERERGKGEE